MSCLGKLAILEISMKTVLFILQYFDITTILQDPKEDLINKASTKDKENKND